jgi:hypothetical protein
MSPFERSSLQMHRHMHMKVHLLRAVALLLTFVAPAYAQRRPAVADSVPRAAIDSFVLTVRDMAAWALVTPAAHVPVGALQDATGNVESVVGAQKSATTLTPDSVLVAFRQALGTGARDRKSEAIGLAYFRNVVPPGGVKPVPVLMVEVEHRSGYRANVVFPYEHTGEHPVFESPFSFPALLHEFEKIAPKPTKRGRRWPGTSGGGAT